ncbi:MAG: hypothetical protein Q8P18_32830 [Pseudomonadota bacterium]|nr:hypothetical protein [Pseudomonadota bacterium]
MKLLPALALVAASGLPCSALCAGVRPTDLDRVEEVLDVLERVNPDQLPIILPAGVVETEVITGACRLAIESRAQTDPARRASLLAEGLSACDLRCAPRPRPHPDLATLTTLIAADCDDAGLPDGVFGGPLAPIRSGMDAMDYVVFRHLFEVLEARLDGSERGEALWARFDRLRPTLAMALDRAADTVPGHAASSAADADAAPTVLGSIDSAAVQAVFDADQSRVRGCVEAARARDAAPAKSPARQQVRPDIAENAGILGALEYDTMLWEMRQSNAPARALIEVVLGPDGAVWSASSRTLEDDAAECVLKGVRELRFPVSRDANLAVLVWPLKLSDAPAVAPR